MRTVNMHEAKAHLSRLVQAAAAGEPFVIAQSGKPVVKVVAMDSPGGGAARRLGFMTGSLSIPEDFDIMGVAEVQTMFEEPG